VSKTGYRDYEEIIDFSEKTKLKIRIYNVISILFADGNPILNLKKTDSDNKLKIYCAVIKCYD
jgi:hypothetical protein